MASTNCLKESRHCSTTYTQTNAWYLAREAALGKQCDQQSSPPVPTSAPCTIAEVQSRFSVFSRWADRRLGRKSSKISSHKGE